MSNFSHILPFVFFLLKVDAVPAVVPPSKSAKKGIGNFLYFAVMPSCFARFLFSFVMNKIFRILNVFMLFIN